jgi:hypothetical protein
MSAAGVTSLAPDEAVLRFTARELSSTGEVPARHRAPREKGGGRGLQSSPLPEIC